MQIKIRDIIDNIQAIISGFSEIEDSSRLSNTVEIKLLNAYVENKLLAIVSKENPNDLLSSETRDTLESFLKDIFDIIRRSNASPAVNPTLRISTILLTLAQQLETPEKSRYKLLFPTLKVDEYVASATHIGDEELQLTEFILNDDDTAIIEILPTLELAKDDGIFKRNDLVDGKPIELTFAEYIRLCCHSMHTLNCASAIKEKLDILKTDQSYGAVLTRLCNALHKGDVDHSGEELNAGDNALTGTHYFNNWFNSLQGYQFHLMRDLEENTKPTPWNIYVKRGNNLELKSELPPNKSMEPGVIYVEKINDHLKYYILTENGQTIEDTIDLKVKHLHLNSMIIDILKSQILAKTKQTGQTQIEGIPEITIEALNLNTMILDNLRNQILAETSLRGHTQKELDNILYYTLLAPNGEVVNGQLQLDPKIYNNVNFTQDNLGNFAFRTQFLTDTTALGQTKIDEDERECLKSLRAPSTTDVLGVLLGRLVRPRDSNYQQTNYCVKLISNAIETILIHNKEFLKKYPINLNLSNNISIDQANEQIETSLKTLKTSFKKLENFKPKILDQYKDDKLLSKLASQEDIVTYSNAVLITLLKDNKEIFLKFVTYVPQEKKLIFLNSINDIQTSWTLNLSDLYSLLDLFPNSDDRIQLVKIFKYTLVSLIENDKDERLEKFISKFSDPKDRQAALKILYLESPETFYNNRNNLDCLVKHVDNTFLQEILKPMFENLQEKYDHNLVVALATISNKKNLQFHYKLISMIEIAKTSSNLTSIPLSWTETIDYLNTFTNPTHRIQLVEIFKNQITSLIKKFSGEQFKNFITSYFSSEYTPSVLKIFYNTNPESFHSSIFKFSFFLENINESYFREILNQLIKNISIDYDHNLTIAKSLETVKQNTQFYEALISHIQKANHLSDISSLTNFKPQYLDDPNISKLLRIKGSFEPGKLQNNESSLPYYTYNNPSHNRSMNIYSRQSNISIRTTYSQLSIGKTEADILSAYTRFKEYLKTEEFISDITVISNEPFGEGGLALFIKSLSKKDRKMLLERDLSNLFSRMESNQFSYGDSKENFMKHIGVVVLALESPVGWYALDNIDHKDPSNTKLINDTLKELKFTFIKGLFAIVYASTPLAIILHFVFIDIEPRPPSKTATAKYPLTIFSLMHKDIFVTDEFSTDALQPEFFTLFRQNNFKHLSELICSTYDPCYQSILDWSKTDKGCNLKLFTNYFLDPFSRDYSSDADPIINTFHMFLGTLKQKIYNNFEGLYAQSEKMNLHHVFNSFELSLRLMPNKLLLESIQQACRLHALESSKRPIELIDKQTIETFKKLKLENTNSDGQASSSATPPVRIMPPEETNPGLYTIYRQDVREDNPSPLGDEEDYETAFNGFVRNNRNKLN